MATAQTEERLLMASQAMTAAQVERLVRAWRRVDRNAENQQATRPQKGRGLSVYQDEDGMVGDHPSAESSRRLACDASRVVMRRDPDGRVVEVGARPRTIPPALRRARDLPGIGL